MSRLQPLLDRVPSHFARDVDSNNYKLLSLIAQNSEDNRQLYETILKFWDIDQAAGIGLDRLGKDEGISRGRMNDQEYRKMIKIQSMMNLSEGDIPTMNLIMDAYLGEHFLGFEEGWINYQRPATLILETRPSENPLPFLLVNKIKTAGVGVIQVEILNPNEPVLYQGAACLSGEITTIYPYYANTPIEATIQYKQAAYHQDVEMITLYMEGDERVE